MMNAKGITLMEILIAVTVLTALLLATSSIYTSGARMQRELNNIRDARAEAHFLMEHVAKNFPHAVSVAQPAIGVPGTRLRFTIDDNFTPDIDTDDDELIYNWSGGPDFEVDYTLTVYPAVTSSTVTLTPDIDTFTVTRDTANRVTIDMTVQSEDQEEEISLRSTFTSLAMPGD